MLTAKLNKITIQVPQRPHAPCMSSNQEPIAGVLSQAGLRFPEVEEVKVKFLALVLCTWFSLKSSSTDAASLMQEHIPRGQNANAKES